VGRIETGAVLELLGTLLAAGLAETDVGEVDGTSVDGTVLDGDGTTIVAELDPTATVVVIELSAEVAEGAAVDTDATTVLAGVEAVVPALVLVVSDWALVATGAVLVDSGVVLVSSDAVAVVSDTGRAEVTEVEVVEGTGVDEPDTDVSSVVEAVAVASEAEVGLAVVETEVSLS